MALTHIKSSSIISAKHNLIHYLNSSSNLKKLLHATDYGNSATQRSLDEYSSLAQARCHAPRKKILTLFKLLKCKVLSWTKLSFFKDLTWFSYPSPSEIGLPRQLQRSERVLVCEERQR